MHTPNHQPAMNHTSYILRRTRQVSLPITNRRKSPDSANNVSTNKVALPFLNQDTCLGLK